MPEIDRRGKILPWHSDEIIGAKRYSPIEALACYLEHLKKYWDHVFALHSKEYAFVQQDVVITVPASFDEVASSLILEAAQKAEYNMLQVKILEEPQASFYDWLQRILPSMQEDQQQEHGFFSAFLQYFPKLF